LESLWLDEFPPWQAVMAAVHKARLKALPIHLLWVIRD
jgi:hypothetical protein